MHKWSNWHVFYIKYYTLTTSIGETVLLVCIVIVTYEIERDYRAARTFNQFLKTKEVEEKSSGAKDNRPRSLRKPLNQRTHSSVVDPDLGDNIGLEYDNGDDIIMRLPYPKDKLTDDEKTNADTTISEGDLQDLNPSSQTMYEYVYESLQGFSRNLDYFIQYFSSSTTETQPTHR